MSGPIRCIIHGSFSKHFELIQQAHRQFSDAGIEVLAPKNSELVDSADGFALFADEAGLDPRLVELRYLNNLRALGESGFSYFVNPKGYIGVSASYELGIAQLTNTKCFFSDLPNDHPVYNPKNTIWKSKDLAAYVRAFKELPAPVVARSEKHIQALWEQLMVPGSVVATGAIIEYDSPTRHAEKEILLVKTHKWGDRYSIVGGKVRRNERLTQALLREVHEETGLHGEVGRHICTFDQLRDSGYYQPAIQHIFVDNVVSVNSKKVRLNEEAQDYTWATPSEALRFLDIEPNARQTLLLYTQSRN